MLGEWFSEDLSEDLSEGPFIWDRAWYRRMNTRALRKDGIDVYVLRIPQNFPVEEHRGKFLVRVRTENFTMDYPVPGAAVPHIFDTLEEAQAVYDLIVDKE